LNEHVLVSYLRKRSYKKPRSVVFVSTAKSLIIGKGEGGRRKKKTFYWGGKAKKGKNEKKDRLLCEFSTEFFVGE